jgi:hypothetical protein
VGAARLPICPNPTHRPTQRLMGPPHTCTYVTCGHHKLHWWAMRVAIGCIEQARLVIELGACAATSDCLATSRQPTTTQRVVRLRAETTPCSAAFSGDLLLVAGGHAYPQACLARQGARDSWAQDKGVATRCARFSTSTWPPTALVCAPRASGVAHTSSNQGELVAEF